MISSDRGRRSPVLTLLHTNDLHGRVYLPGEAQGLTKIATLVRAVRREMPHVLLLDAGDRIHGTPEEKAFGGEPIQSAMNALGYDAAVAGNHEFDFGQATLRNALRHARFPTLSANVVDARTGKPWDRLRPFVLREIGGVRVAIFGLTTPETVKLEWPRTLAGIRFEDPVVVARTLVPRLRERADVVIGLTHLGVFADGLLADAVPGIDVIVGGHSHTAVTEPLRMGDTLIVQTGAHARALGRVDLLVRKDGGKPGEIVSVNGRNRRWWGHGGEPAPAGKAYPSRPLLPLSPATPDDRAVLAAYRPYADRLRLVLDEVLTTAGEPLPAGEATLRETAIGNLLADAVRAGAKADVGMAASGQIEARGLLAGPVRVRDLYRLLGGYTRQHLVTARVTGARLRVLLRAARDGGRLHFHVSGVRVGEPLDDARRYTIAGAAHLVQDYLLGKEGVEILADDPRALTVRDAAIAFLRGHVPLRNVTDGRLAAGIMP